MFFNGQKSLTHINCIHVYYPRHLFGLRFTAATTIIDFPRMAEDTLSNQAGTSCAMCTVPCWLESFHAFPLPPPLWYCCPFIVHDTVFWMSGQSELFWTIYPKIMSVLCLSLVPRFAEWHNYVKVEQFKKLLSQISGQFELCWSMDCSDIMWLHLWRRSNEKLLVWMRLGG